MFPGSPNPAMTGPPMSSPMLCSRTNQWVDSLTNCGPMARRQGFVFSSQLAEEPGGLLTGRPWPVLHSESPPAPLTPAPPSWRQLFNASCSLVVELGEGEGRHCPLGQPLPGQVGPSGHPQPQNARPGVQASGRPPRGCCSPLPIPICLQWPLWPIQLRARHLRPPGLYVKFCRQSRQTSLSEGAGRTEA